MKFLIIFTFIIFVNAYPEKRPVVTIEEVSSEEENVIPLDHPWSCGTDAFSLLIAEGTIDKDCPAVKNQVNNCCVHHDKCYDDQLGRDFCDDTFCECLQTATISNKLCHEDDAHVFCHLVRELGESAYNASGNRNSSESTIDDADPLADLLETSHALNQTTNDEYYDYYEKSVDIKKIIVQHRMRRRTFTAQEVLSDPVINRFVKTL